MIFQVNINIINDGNSFMQNFYIECTLPAALFDKINQQIELINGVVESITINQFAEQKRFEKTKYERVEK